MMDKKDYVSPEMKIKHIDFKDILTSSIQTHDGDQGTWLTDEYTNAQTN